MSTGGDLLGLIDPKITIGNLIEVITFVGGGLIALVKLNNNVVSLQINVSSMQDEIKKISEVLTRQAVLDTRVAAAEQDIRDMQRGRGFITRERYGIDGEHP